MKPTPTLEHSPLNSTAHPQQQEGGLPGPTEEAHRPPTGAQPQPAQPGPQQGQLQNVPSLTTQHQADPQQVKLVTYIFSLCTYYTIF